MSSSFRQELFFTIDLDDSQPVPLNYQPKINLQRFQQFLEAEEKNATLSTISGMAGMSHLGQTFASQIAGLAQSSQLPDQTNLNSKGTVNHFIVLPSVICNLS